MTAYRCRFKPEADPRALHRDIVVGRGRPLTELHRTLNDSLGLPPGHLWFFGEGRSYFDSGVQFTAPEDSQEPMTPMIGRDEEVHDAGESTVGALAERLDLGVGDRICYVYDYGADWRFYAILKRLLDDESGSRAAEVVGSAGGDPAGPRDP